MRIENGTVTFYDNPKELYTKVEGFYFNLNGNMTSATSELKLKTGWDAFQFYSSVYSLENKLKLDLESDFVRAFSVYCFRYSIFKVQIRGRPWR